MAKLVLHVGAHKTGTTFIQNLFHTNRDRLAKAGIYYPDIGPNTAHHVLARPWMKMRDVPNSFFGPRGPEGPWQDLIARYAKAEGTVFLSAENLSRAHPEVVNMAELADRLSVFEDVRVIYTMRVQTEMIQSLWLQLAKTGNRTSIYSYVRNALERGRAVGVWIDHNVFYDKLLTGFAPEQITFLDYSECRAAPGGIAQVFLDLLGSDLRSEALIPLPKHEANISPDPLGYWIATGIDQSFPADPALIAAVTKSLAETDRPNTLLARHEYRRVAARFQTSNHTLVTRLRQVQPDFTFQDVTTPDNMIYRGEVPDKVWMEVVRRVLALAPADNQPAPDFLGRAREVLSRLIGDTKMS